MLPLRLRRGLFGRSNRNPDENNQNNDNNDNDSSGEQPQSSSLSKPDPDTENFFPTLWDVLKVRYILQWKLKKLVPPELVDAIIDQAEYWPSTKHVMEGQRRILWDRDQVLFKTVPLCFDRKSLEEVESPKPLPHRTAHPCRKIIFHLSSHDQGGSRIHEDMYQGSFTWFDAEVIREAHKKRMYVDGTEQEILEDETGKEKRHFEPTDELLLPRSKQLQMNGARVSETQDRVIIWHYLDNVSPESTEAHDIERTEGRGRYTLDGQVVRELEVGDSVALWGRARFGQWANHVFQASARVFWAV
ncbi:hypothetical protein N7481_008971 [Penicillium waksmanii]|uniref:uncharacterized protein n=1 Tax=Penicillium waksmanii TaxID=69791 RepID=UPI002548BEFD|nr:uncharacterized protein N7481_008971 [Penicillium waksmanii]KAJ5975264.1 hypothetical protein N7481_008971 [Penicillium waksmanii]